MTLRLVGEETALQGLDGAGWLREITVTDSGPALAIDQLGSGDIAAFQDGGSDVLRVRQTTVDMLQPLRNPGSANNGDLTADDDVAILGTHKLNIGGTSQSGGTQNSLRLYKYDNTRMVIEASNLGNTWRDLHLHGMNMFIQPYNKGLKIASQTPDMNEPPAEDVLDVKGGDIYVVTQGRGYNLVPNATAGAATADDLTKKRFRVVKRATAPTSAYVAFSNNPGTDTFYLILEDV